MGRAIEEATHDREQFRLIEQESVVTFVGGDLRERNPRTARIAAGVCGEVMARTLAALNTRTPSS